LAFHYTKGKGYYENYIADAAFVDYGLLPVGTQTTTDLIRQKWLDNDFYGTTFSANYKSEKLDVILGGGWNKYEGDHFGKVIWARYASQSELGDHYYNDAATKKDGNVFAKANYQITEKISLFGDLQLRNVHYQADSPETGMVNDNFTFFNPKAGLNYDLNANNKLYFSYAKANREPNRTDYENGNPKPEKLNDYELGWRLETANVKVNTNVYYMTYKDQLILTGKLDDVGNPIRSNSDKSYRLGLEIDATIALSEKCILRPNFTLSENKNVDLNIGFGNFTTDIAYSPNLIAGNIFIYKPIEGLQISLLQKFVGKQFMNNSDSPESILESYFINDINVGYEFKPKSVFKSIMLTGLVNNVFDKKYVLNGYMWDVYPYYYPQAGINLLVGLNLKF
jgi:iron complex outermembrane receptor protein